VVGHQRHVVRPLQITGLDQVFALYETLRAALAV
jgi:anti-anti-sigma regulatory factor